MRDLIARIRSFRLPLDFFGYGEVARQENAELRKLVERQAAMLHDKLGETQLVDMRGGASAGGGLDIRLAGGPVGYIAEYLFQLIRAGSADGTPYNYTETECFPRVEVQHRSGERYVLTVQRVHGLTPAEKERAATNRADVAKRALDRVIGERDEARVSAARAEQMRAALEPFATHGLNPDKPGVDLLVGLMRDRIVDWFGPSDFVTARLAYTEAPANG